LKRFVTFFANLFPTSVIVGFLIPLLLISVPLNVLSAVAQTEASQTDPQVAEFLATINRSVVSLGGKSEAEAGRICGQIVSSALNIDSFVRSAGSRMWDRMSQRQQTAYRGAIERRAIRDCVSQNRNNDGQPLVFVGIRQSEGGDRLLATRSNNANQVHTVIWRLRGSGRRLRAVDILFDGRSATLIFRDEMNVLLDRFSEDIDAVIETFGR